MSYQAIINAQRDFFQTNQTLSYTFRYESLTKLKQAILTYEKQIADALFLDLGKIDAESFLTEIGIALSEITYVTKHLKSWMRRKKVKTPFVLFKASSYQVYEPYGVTAILSPWNYPFQLSINPVIGALASGNTVILKPSSSSSHTAQVLKEMLESVFPPEYVYVLTGPAAEAEKLLNERLDYIFFTGSTAVGKKIMQQASAHLTPVTLELGGKSPCIIDADVDLKLASKRIAFGKLINAGQTCIAPDYVLIPEALKSSFIRYYQDAVHEFYGSYPIQSMWYPKIINQRQKDRLISYLDPSKMVYGGAYSKEKIAPTLLDSIDFDSEIMQEEIFGPILPILTYTSHEELIATLRNKEKPLAFYLFTKNKKIEDLYVQQLSFGGGTINDTLVHFMNHHLGFGGVGYSGMGNYHGHQSFATFSHLKGIVKRSNHIDLSVRYHPLTDKKKRLMRKFLK